MTLNDAGYLVMSLAGVAMLAWMYKNEQTSDSGAAGNSPEREERTPSGATPPTGGRR